MAYAPFVPLRVFSSYSMLDGAIDPKAIAKLAKERGFPAIAMTDRNGLYGAMSFASACKDAGIQPLVGTYLAVQRESGGPIDWLLVVALFQFLDMFGTILPDECAKVGALDSLPFAQMFPCGISL